MRYPLEIPLSPSRRISLLIAAIHLVAAVAFLFSSLPCPVRLPALALIVASLCVALFRERAKAGCAIRLDGSGAFAVGRHGDLHPARLQQGCTDFGWAVWLQWRTDGKGKKGRRGAVMLAPDNLPQERWRSLRIWLKHKVAAAGTEAAAKDAS